MRRDLRRTRSIEHDGARGLEQVRQRKHVRDPLHPLRRALEGKPDPGQQHHGPRQQVQQAAHELLAGEACRDGEPEGDHRECRKDGEQPEQREAADRMKVNDRADAGVQHAGHEQDQAKPGEHLRAEELERRERRGMQALEEAVLAVPQHDVAHPEQAAEHHVHAEDPGKQPVDVARRGAGHRLAGRAGRRCEQQLLDDVALGRVGVHPVAGRILRRGGAVAEIDEQVDLLMRDLVQTVRLARDGYEVDVALAQEGMRTLVDRRCGGGGRIALRASRAPRPGDDAHLEQRPFRPTEHEAHADDEHDR